MTITSDASGNWGCGAFEVKKDVRITVKELLPVVMAVAIWGHKWRRKSVKCQCDNAAMVAIINTGTSKNEKAMGTAFFFLAHHDIRVWAEYLTEAKK